MLQVRSYFYKSELFLHLAECAAGVIGGFLGALLHLRLKIRLVGRKLLESLLNGSERVRANLTHSQLEVAVALSFKFLFYLLHGLAREAGIYRHKVVDAVLALGKAHAGLGVGDGSLELADDGVLVVKNVDDGVYVLV